MALVAPSLAQATDWDEIDLATQMKDADATMEGKVLSVTPTTVEGGVPVTHIYIQLLDQIDGKHNLPSTFRLVFPGGHFGTMVFSYSGFPEPEVGDSFIAVLHHIESDLYGLENGPSSLILEQGSMAMTSYGNPIVDVRCTGRSLVAMDTANLPMERVLLPDDESDIGVLRRVVPESSSRVYSDQPLTLGLPWAQARGAVRNCRQPRPIPVSSIGGAQ